MNWVQRDIRLGVGEEDVRMKQVNMTSVIVERLPGGRDILEGLNDLVHAKKITTADFTAIGAVSRAVVGFFVGRGQYSERLFEGPLEIVSCVGNVSVKENQPFIHAHISLADRKGNVFGGHLLPG
ncbi:MAG: PPC domain-containing DNA-binding protein [Candidatus Bathyarchaeia archaeon]